MDQVTIIMYHYVRELPLTRYPKIKGLKVSEFKHQLDYLQEHFNFITIQKCIEAIYGGSTALPEDAVLLTFDDGYSEHFTDVFPLLNERNIQGAFFPPAEAILEHKMLDVNKIHFILASAPHLQDLLNKTNSLLKSLANEFDLQTPAYYFNKIKTDEHRYDPPEVVYIKRLLQRELSQKPRSIILNELFSEFVNVKEKTFARELYLNLDQIKCMQRNGMFFGGHGHAHCWLDTLNTKEQKFEIQKTMDFLNAAGTNINQWVMCYPYGAYNNELLELLKREKCMMGLTTTVGQARLNKKNAFTLQRFDTNDFPK